MSDCMTFPDTLDEFLEQYQFKDEKEVYTNGSMLIPVFRVKQWAEHIPVDAVEVRHGWWEDVEIVDEDIVAENHTMIASMFCPVCKRYASTVYHYGNPMDMMNYCPNCGVKMDGQRREEENNAAD